MSVEILTTKPKGFSNRDIRWIEVLQTHDELSIIFPDGTVVKVAYKEAARTVIRHWAREVGHVNAASVRVMWPKSHETVWAADI